MIVIVKLCQLEKKCFKMIDEIKPPTPPKKVIIMFEMISPELADWFLNLDIVDRESIIYDAYIKYTLKKEEIK